MTSWILAGLGMASIGIGGRILLRHGKTVTSTINKNIPTSALSKYYRGGFESKMSKREASLILGVSPTTPQTKVKDAHKRIMLLNHPDRGGSPYLAAKINEAKDLLDKAAGKRS